MAGNRLFETDAELIREAKTKDDLVGVTPLTGKWCSERILTARKHTSNLESMQMSLICDHG